MSKKCILNFVETKGDVTFYKDQNGNLYQKLGLLEPYRVKNGKISYRYITNVRGLDIKYQNNGCNGFTIFKGKTALEDNIWVFNDAERIALELGNKSDQNKQHE